MYRYNLIKIFKALADEMRLRIARVLLRGTFNVNEVFFIVGGKQSNISHHLKVLQDCNLIIGKKEGLQVFYRINDIEENKLILDLIKKEEENIDFYDDDLARFEAILQKRKKIADEYFNNVGEEFETVQSELFGKIYSTEDAIRLFGTNLDTIVDIGCGTGINLPILSKYAKKVVGFDSSAKMIRLSEHICQKYKLNYDLKMGDINKLPFIDESVDGVFVNMVLHHISNPSGVFNEFQRILTKNGKILFIDLLSHDDESFREKYADLWLGFSFTEINEWFTKNNFTINEEIIKTDKENPSLKVIIILAQKN